MSSGLLDTSVLIQLDNSEIMDLLPDQIAICAISLAELAAGPHCTSDSNERARRQMVLQIIESNFEPLRFDSEAARSYGLIIASVVSIGRSHRSRIADLLIASVAHANNLDLYTCNPSDFKGISKLVNIFAV
jgi:predicted nucleic acid-binding protein